MMRKLILAAALLAAPLPAAAQEQEDHLAEPTCIYRQMVDAAEAKREVTDLEVFVAPCRARYGWDDATKDRALTIAVAIILQLGYADEAVKAGVNLADVDAVADAMTPEQIAAYGMPGEPVSNTTSEVIRFVLAQLSAKGLTGEALKKAHTVISSRALVANLVTDFYRKKEKR